MTELEYIRELLALELIQREEEGCDVGAIKARSKQPDADIKRLRELYDELTALPVKRDFAYYEPDSLYEIIKASAGGFDAVRTDIDPDKFEGAWLGRCIGCALGKPLETSPFTCGRDGIAGSQFVYEWFKGAGAYPINDYVPSHSACEQQYGICVERGSAPSFRENIAYMQTDDDIRYMVLALMLLENKGLDFTVRDVCDIWRRNLPVDLLYTAERQAYLNACDADLMLYESKDKYEYIRMHNNPYREWIGAQIRVDVYAYACAGDPQRAARLAYTDASFSHVKNGVYGALFCAAMIAEAFVSNDVQQVINAGLSVIPQKSRLYSAVKRACELARDAKSELELAQKINTEFSAYHPIHTINNAAVCAGAIIYGKGDFTASVTAAVLGGWDTDCNGATVGSVLGAMNGAGGIDDKWKLPLNDTLYSSIPGFHPISISECALRSYKLWEQFKPI